MRHKLLSTAACCFLSASLASAEPADDILPLGENIVTGQVDVDIDPRAFEIMSAMEALSDLSGDALAQAVATLMVQFAAVMPEDEFAQALESWRASLLPQIDSAAVMAALESTQWISAAQEGRAVHVVMDIECDPCRDMLQSLQALAEDMPLDIRVTVLPLVSDETFPVALGLLSDPDLAWARLAGLLDGTQEAGSIEVAPDLSNEDLQAVVEADFDTLIGTGLRNLPVTGFRTEEGEARIIMGAMSADDLREILYP